MKRLIVNADDFGLTPGINRGILAACTEGIVNSLSLMPTGRAFPEAAEMARSLPGIDAGIHLALTGETPLSPADRIPSLVEPGGLLLRTPHRFFFRYLLGRISSGEAERELRSQIEAFLLKNLTPSHVDSHCHIHMFPPLFRLVSQLAAEYRIPRIRISCESLWQRPDLRSLNLKFGARCLQIMGLNVLAGGFRERARRIRLQPADHTTGLQYSGHLGTRRLLSLLERLQSGATEIICHPGYENDPARNRYGHWNYEWEAELEALTAPQTREKIRQLKIKTAFSNQIGPTPPSGPNRENRL